MIFMLWKMKELRVRARATGVWWKGIQAEGRAGAQALRWGSTWCLRVGVARAGGEQEARGQTPEPLSGEDVGFLGAKWEPE